MMTLAGFVAGVAEALEPPCTVFVGSFGSGADALVGVCATEEAPDYLSGEPGRPENVEEVKAALEAVGFCVVTDSTEREAQLQEWYEMGGGIGLRSEGR